MNEEQLLSKYFGKEVFRVSYMGKYIVAHFDTNRYLSNTATISFEKFAIYSKVHNVLSTGAINEEL